MEPKEEEKVPEKSMINYYQDKYGDMDVIDVMEI